MNVMKKIIRHLGLYKVWFYFGEKNYLSDEVDGEKCQIELEKYNPDTKSSCIQEYNMNENQIKVSIIVPAYNASNYIRECLNSLVKQETIYKYEIIVVNDGSTDDTASIVKSFKCSYLRIIDKPNGGISSARNEGIKNAFGEFLIFCDADDYMDKKAIQLLVDKAEHMQADIVEGTYCYISETGKIGHTVKHKKRASKRVDTFGVPWCKCIKKSLFTNIGFPINYWFEDSIIHQIILAKANRIVWIDDVIYYYRTNSGGATSTSIGNPKSIDSLWISISLLDDRQKMNISNSLDYYKYMLNMLRLGFHRTEALPENIRKDFYYIYANFIDRNFEKQKFRLIEFDFANMQRLITNINYSKYCEYFYRT